MSSKFDFTQFLFIAPSLAEVNFSSGYHISYKYIYFQHPKIKKETPRLRSKLVLQLRTKSVSIVTEFLE